MFACVCVLVLLFVVVFLCLSLPLLTGVFVFWLCVFSVFVLACVCVFELLFVCVGVFVCLCVRVFLSSVLVCVACICKCGCVCLFVDVRIACVLRLLSLFCVSLCVWLCHLCSSPSMTCIFKALAASSKASAVQPFAGGHSIRMSLGSFRDKPASEFDFLPQRATCCTIWGSRKTQSDRACGRLCGFSG